MIPIGIEEDPFSGMLIMVILHIVTFPMISHIKSEGQFPGEMKCAVPKMVSYTDAISQTVRCYTMGERYPLQVKAVQ